MKGKKIVDNLLEIPEKEISPFGKGGLKGNF